MVKKNAVSKEEQSLQVSIRLRPDEADRLDRLVDQMKKAMPDGTFSRTTLLREAMHRYLRAKTEV